MNTTLKRLGAPERLAVIYPLGGLVVMWFAFLGAQIWELYNNINPYDNNGNYNVASEQVKVSTYLFLLGIAALGVAAVLGKANADKAPESRLAKASRGFSIIAVIFALIVGAVFGIGQFGSAFNAFQNEPHNQIARIFGVYVPILLDAALLVFVILKAFVGKKDGEDDE
ncbi:MAG: hypothetical protein ACKORF_03465 [Micrococcales bacterium]